MGFRIRSTRIVPVNQVRAGRVRDVPVGSRAGLKVLVLEQYHTIGGMTATEEETLLVERVCLVSNDSSESLHSSTTSFLTDSTISSFPIRRVSRRYQCEEA